MEIIIPIAEITAIFCFVIFVTDILIVDFMKAGTIKIRLHIKFSGDDKMKLQPTKILTEAFRKAARILQLETDRSFLLEMNSEGNLRITGITDIKGYDECTILVVSIKYVTEIKGQQPFMQRFSDSEIIVSGEIGSISFMKR